MPKGSTYPVAVSVQDSDTVLGIVGGQTNQIPTSLLRSLGVSVLTADTTVNIPAGSTAAQVQALIDAQPKCLNAVLTFQFANGTYNLASTITFKGFYGNGTLKITGNQSEDANALHTNQAVILNFTNTIGLSIQRNSVPDVTIQNLKISVGGMTGSNSGISNLNNLSRVNITGCWISCDTTAYGHNIYSASCSGGVYIYSTNFTGFSTAIYIGWASTVMSRNNATTGTSAQYGVIANRSILYKEGTQPTGSITQELPQAGAQIWA